MERDDWIAMTTEPLRVADVLAWAGQAGCGAIDCFVGTVRDHSEGRPGVERLEYEAYGPAALARLGEIAAEARRRWPIGRLAMLHRTGVLGVGEASVVVALSTPHRAESFAATQWCIDTLKATVPIWKREVWEGGDDWGLCAHELTEVPEATPTGQ